MDVPPIKECQRKAVHNLFDITYGHLFAATVREKTFLCGTAGTFAVVKTLTAQSEQALTSTYQTPDQGLNFLDYLDSNLMGAVASLSLTSVTIFSEVVPKIFLRSLYGFPLLRLFLLPSAIFKPVISRVLTSRTSAILL